jgi:putative FmdB family regulatory protein
MPIYEYRCGCGKEFERYVATTGGATTCPSCGSTGVKRTLSVFALKSAAGPVASSMPSGGGGCCGGGCACH